MKMLRKSANVRGIAMSAQKRCGKCGLYMCEHLRADIPIQEELPVLSLASQSGTAELLADLEKTERPAHPRIRVSSSKDDDNTLYNLDRTSTIPMGATTQAQGIIIPPPPKVPLIASAKDIKDRWVKCSICKANICIDYLARHEIVHVNEHKTAANSSSTTPSNSTSSAIIKLPPSTNTASYSAPVQENKPKLSPIERYKFRGIDTACAASSMSQDSRYSDFTVIFWLHDKINVSSGHYSGSSTSSTWKECERLSVHVVFDSIEEYYTVTTKLMKRSSYSTYDNEENVPDRICINAKEVGDEVKRALLFFCVSPRAAYKQFRKLFKQDLSIDYDACNRACIVQTANCETLFERLKRPADTTYANHSYCDM